MRTYFGRLVFGSITFKPAYNILPLLSSSASSSKPPSKCHIYELMVYYEDIYAPWAQLTDDISAGLSTSHGNNIILTLLTIS